MRLRVKNSWISIGFLISYFFIGINTSADSATVSALRASSAQRVYAQISELVSIARVNIILVVLLILFLAKFYICLRSY